MIQKNIILILILLLGACGSNGDTSSGAGSSASSVEVTKIVALGDSIGARAPHWPGMVNQSLGVQLVNYSRDSLTTSNFVGRVDGILDRDKPSHLLILLGTNDARKGNVSGAISNLQAMANASINRDVKVVIGTIPPNLRNSSHNQNAAAISSGIRGLANAQIAKVRNALGSGSEYLPDGIHPNSAGSRVIANEFLSQMSE